jgi:hypothetical protein
MCGLGCRPTIRMNKSGMMKRERHLLQKFFHVCLKPVQKWQLSDVGCLDLKEIGYKCVDWVQSYQDMAQ